MGLQPSNPPVGCSSSLTFLHEIFPFPRLHQFPGSSHSQPLPGPNQGGHHSTRRMKTNRTSFHSLTSPSLQVKHHRTVFLAPYTLLQAPFKFPTLDIFYALVPTPSLFIYSLRFPLPSFFPAFTPSPIGGRRTWEKDVEESGFSFARSRLTSTPKGERRTETIASVSALRSDSLVSPSQCLSLPSAS